MERSIVEQEREIKDVVRRAKGNPDKTGSLRRDTLKRLIDLTHSPHSTLKILAAQNIRFLFNDFPDLEEEAINAVYDLCEDQSPKVRIEGYTAITQVSKAENKWVKRNADVLLQLLQSDEPDEVIVVKKALTEHLDMDPKVTLGVLCDQIAPPDEPMDEEEQSIRDRLRSLVLSFLTGEAKRAIVERHALPGSGAEETLINSLLVAIPKLGFNDVQIIVKDLLLPLNAYKPRSTHGYTLLKILLDKAAADLRAGTRSSDATALHSAQAYLGLVAFVVVEKRAAPAIQLLRFYCSSISTKITLQKFSKADQPLIICNLAETLVAASEEPDPKDDGMSLDALRRHVVDSCPFLLESLALSSSSLRRTVNACTILLRTCLQRKEQVKWTPPANLVSILGTIQDVITSEQSQDVPGLIRSLVSSSSNPVTYQGRSAAQGPPTKATQPARSTNDNGRPSSLPERPVLSPPPRRMNIPHGQASRPRDRDQIMANPPSRDNPSRPNTPKHQLAPEPSSRPPKRQRGGEDEDERGAPSLLSRLGSSVSSNPARRTTPPARPPHIAQQAPAGSHLPPNGEYSIKGAANKLDSRHPGMPAPRRSHPQTFSLLDRLEGGSSHMEDDKARRNRGRS